MFRLVAALVLLLSSVVVASAANKQCLKPHEAEAERAIRFQAELMVMSDTCGQQTYIEFAQRNREVLVAYQHEMIAHFRRTGITRAEARFDTYLTRLANEVSLRAGAQPVTSVCRDAAQLLTMAQTLDKDKFRRYIAEHAAEDSPEFRRCPR
jgi:hypothetical protein